MRLRQFGGVCGTMLCALLAAAPVARAVTFTSEATVSYSLRGRTLITNQTQIDYIDSRSLTTLNPWAEPARLSGSVGGVQGGGDNSASVFINANVEGGAGLMRAQITGSSSATWIYGASLAEARVIGATAGVGWKDAYVITGDPADPHPGRPLLIQAFLNVSGGMSSQVSRIAEVSIQLHLSAKDDFQRNLLAIAPPYSGSFAFEYNKDASNFTYIPRPAPSTIPLLLMVNEGQAALMDFYLEIVGVAVAQGNGFGQLQSSTSSLSFDADYSHTLSWGGISSIVDANTGQPLSNWSVRAASGVNYANAVPEPGSAALLLLAAVGAWVRRPTVKPSPKRLRQFCGVCGTTLCAMLATAPVARANYSPYQGPNLGSWNDSFNWITFRPPSVYFDETGMIDNGATVILSQHARSEFIPNPGLTDTSVGGLLLGASNSGGLRITNGGYLPLVAGVVEAGAAQIGLGGQGNLEILGGGTMTTAQNLTLAGAGASSISLGDTSGLTANLIVGGQANLQRNTIIVGPNVNFSVGGNLSLSGTLTPVITSSTSHSPIVTQGTAFLGGTLRPILNGISPSLGDTWTLIDAAAINGTFSNLDLSLAPALPAGLSYQITQVTNSPRTLLQLAVAQTPIVYEPFDYAPAGADLHGKNGGSGFAGLWTGDTNYDLGVDSLAFGGLTTSGHHMVTGAGGSITEITRLLSAARGTAGTTSYLSFVVRPEGTLGQGAFNGFFGLRLNSSLGGGLFIGKPGGGAVNEFVLENDGGAQQVTSGVAAEVGEEYLLVLRADFTNGNDTFTLYVNPTPGAPEPISGTIKNDLDLDIHGMTIYSTGAFSIDEIRLGDTFAAVVPAFALHPGDANGDGMVNLSDLQILGDNWQSNSASWSEADFTGDGQVNLADLQILGDNWGAGVGLDVQAVPEPTAAGALLLAGSVMLLRRGRRRQLLLGQDEQL